MVGAAVSAVLLLLTRRWLTAAIAIALTAAGRRREFRSSSAPPRPNGTDRSESSPRMCLWVKPIQSLHRHRNRQRGRRRRPGTHPAAGRRPRRDRHRSHLPLPGPRARRVRRTASVSGAATRSSLRAHRGLPAHHGQRRHRRPRHRQDAVFVAIHLPGPWPQDIDGLARGNPKPASHSRRRSKTRPTARPVVVAGDFNATYDMAPFRKLLTNGYADAAEQSGAGLLRTFPAEGQLGAALRDRPRPDQQRDSHRRADDQDPGLRSPGTAHDGASPARRAPSHVQ